MLPAVVCQLWCQLCLDSISRYCTSMLHATRELGNVDPWWCEDIGILRIRTPHLQQVCSAEATPDSGSRWSCKASSTGVTSTRHCPTSQYTQMSPMTNTQKRVRAYYEGTIVDVNCGFQFLSLQLSRMARICWLRLPLPLI